MFALSHKSKQYLLVALKVLILTFTFVYIYLKVSQNETINTTRFSEKILDENSLLPGLIFIGLAILNWFFEILKWKKIVSKITPISFFTSLKQSLASLTVSLATPNRIGEYGAKAYYFESHQRKKVMLYNLFHNSFQMFITTILGIIGLYILFENNYLKISIDNIVFKITFAIIIVIFTLLLGYIFRSQQLIFKGLTIKNLIQKFKELSLGLKLKMLLFSVLRYLIFSFLFFYLLLFFGASITLFEAVPFIFSMYLISSIVPTLSFFDVIIKGGVAVWVFSFIGISEVIILSTVFCMWILNFVVPALFGAYFLMTYKPIRA
ncbi:MAG: hypothetical protein ACI93N_000291 [Flavobacteriaceae bacterium]|jgi:hypothetical protein